MLQKIIQIQHKVKQLTPCCVWLVGLLQFNDLDAENASGPFLSAPPAICFLPLKQ